VPGSKKLYPAIWLASPSDDGVDGEEVCVVEAEFVHKRSSFRNGSSLVQQEHFLPLQGITDHGSKITKGGGIV